MPRGQGAEGVGAGLRSRICAHRLLAGAPSPPPEPPPSVVREAHLVHARRVAPRRDARAAAHRQPPRGGACSDIGRPPARKTDGCSVDRQRCRSRKARTHRTTTGTAAAPLPDYTEPRAAAAAQR